MGRPEYTPSSHCITTANHEGFVIESRMITVGLERDLPARD
ncbi:MAG: hypothetical protein AVDCRST_MAG33-805 [uncultured Thermomicrobiales bacterium]|uniref:Uncharacterized protein n=1 Tax=uncultured Thermomicrobiales bacterium TaxID=1645740 RepID=A0A6J4UJZ2_9BACT|nr:MAG: hypothetical protein AVDCRST_MAG33-805 [uncultured Thermomicrobiales bacterium]